MACSPSGAGGLSETFHGSLPTPRSYIHLLAMSVQLRINGLQARRPSVKGTARRLVRLSDIPESPTVTGPVCEALELDGRPCQVALASTTKDYGVIGTITNGRRSIQGGTKHTEKLRK